MHNISPKPAESTRVSKRARSASRRRWLTSLEPTELLIYGFTLAVVLGTAGLMLPGSTVHGQMRLIDALFTATSALSVTGLTVVDTGTHFTLQGQLIILVLIQ